MIHIIILVHRMRWLYVNNCSRGIKLLFCKSWCVATPPPLCEWCLHIPSPRYYSIGKSWLCVSLWYLGSLIVTQASSKELVKTGTPTLVSCRVWKGVISFFFFFKPAEQPQNKHCSRQNKQYISKYLNYELFKATLERHMMRNSYWQWLTDLLY